MSSYITQRIRQHLNEVDFDNNSDDNEEWNDNNDNTIYEDITPQNVSKKLRKRKTELHYEDLDISSDEEPEDHPAKRLRKNIYDELNSDNSSDEENLQNEIVVTPPQSIQISPIRISAHKCKGVKKTFI